MIFNRITLLRKLSPKVGGSTPKGGGGMKIAFRHSLFRFTIVSDVVKRREGFGDVGVV